jgi:hypothetical protein
MPHVIVQLGSGLAATCPSPRDCAKRPRWSRARPPGWPPRACRALRRLAFQATTMVDTDSLDRVDHPLPSRLWSATAIRGFSDDL